MKRSLKLRRGRISRKFKQRGGLAKTNEPGAKIYNLWDPRDWEEECMEKEHVNQMTKCNANNGSPLPQFDGKLPNEIDSEYTIRRDDYYRINSDIQKCYKKVNYVVMNKCNPAQVARDEAAWNAAAAAAAKAAANAPNADILALCGVKWNSNDVYADKMLSLIEKGDDIEETDQYGNNALIKCAFNGNDDGVRLLIDGYTQIAKKAAPKDLDDLNWSKSVFSSMTKFMNIRTHEDYTPLMIAVKTAHINIVRKLLSYGADPTLWRWDKGLETNSVHYAIELPDFIEEKVLIYHLVKDTIPWSHTQSQPPPPPYSGATGDKEGKGEEKKKDGDAVGHTQRLPPPPPYSGATGSTGATGDKGSQGDSGASGKAGATGSDGAVVVAAGEEGDAGQGDAGEVSTLQLRRRCKELGLDRDGSRVALLARLEEAGESIGTAKGAEGGEKGKKGGNRSRSRRSRRKSRKSRRSRKSRKSRRGR